jgi:hypothetical protein
MRLAFFSSGGHESFAFPRLSSAFNQAVYLATLTRENAYDVAITNLDLYAADLAYLLAWNCARMVGTNCVKMVALKRESDAARWLTA